MTRNDEPMRVRSIFDGVALELTTIDGLDPSVCDGACEYCSAHCVEEPTNYDDDGLLSVLHGGMVTDGMFDLSRHIGDTIRAIQGTRHLV